MNDLKGKKILIFQQRGWAKNIGHYLADDLQKNGCRLAALTLKKTTHKIIKNQKTVKYERIINIDEIFENPKKILAGESIYLEEICRELNIDSVWPMLVSNRLFTRSYREKFYYSFRQNVPDEFITDYIKAYYKVLRDLFSEFKPDAVFTAAFVYEGHIMLNLFANKYNIPIVSITDTRIQGYYVFTNDYLDRKGPLIDRCNDLQSGKVSSDNSEEAKKYIQDFRKKFKKPAYMVDDGGKINLRKKIKREINPYIQVLRWCAARLLKGPSINEIKSVGASIDYRTPRIILRDHYAQKKYEKFAKNFDYYPFDKINKFAFYPLQYTPEGSADLTSPLFNNQIEMARQIAMSLPDDYTLVVKEHPAMVGLRSPSYLEKVFKTPNVKLVDYRISSEEILKKASLVISSYSTTLQEAAFYWKPAIILGDVGTFLLLPNVFRHSDLTSLSKKIKELLRLDLKTSQYEKQLENYVAAALDVGFDINYRKIWYEKDVTFLKQLINKFTEEIKRNIFSS